MTPLQQFTPNATAVVDAGDGPLGDLPMFLLDFVLSLGTFVLAYLVVRVVLVALTSRVLAEHQRVEQVRLAAKVVSFAFALVVAAIPLDVSIPRLGGLTLLAFAGPFVFLLALGTVGIERALASRGVA